MMTFEVENHAPSYLPDGEWKLVWSDEFDGPELDRTKWDFRLAFWGKENPAYTDQGIRFDGHSNIELHRTERDGCYVSPQLQTGSLSFDIPKTVDKNPWTDNETPFWPLGELPEPKFMHRYGYYECRCKFQKYPGEMWSAFWVQSPSIGTTFDPSWSGIESDIIEYIGPNWATTGNIMGGYSTHFREEGRIHYRIEETEGYHYFGMDWSPDGYVFYMDGEKISETHETVSHVPEFILLTTEVHGYRVKKPLKVNGEFVDDAFIVDHVRVFDRVK